MQFKTLALATTSLVALGLTAGGASAGNMYAGKVNLGLGYAWEDYHSDGGESSFDLEYSVVHGGGSVNIPYNEWVNLQLDAWGSASLDNGPSGSGSFFGGFGADAHVFWRDPEVGAIGVFAALGRVNGGSFSSSNYAAWEAGLEGEYYCGNWTLRAQLGYLDSDGDGYLLQEAGLINATVLYYPSKHLKLSAGIGYADGTVRTSSGPSSFVNSDQWNWTVGVEYLFGKSIPASVYLNYHGRDINDHMGPTWNIDRNAVDVGVRFPFGGGGEDIKLNDREGVGFESPKLIEHGQGY
ncbi:MAG: hypothetical protein GC190_15095 [Alphaproteobacteria bacterium]|nr:hypothetical protein [Alphaproteobacteria bacterium]